MSTTIDVTALATGLEGFVSAILQAIGQFLTAILSNSTLIYAIIVLSFVSFLLTYVKRKFWNV